MPLQRKRLLVSLGLGQLLAMPACELIGLIPKIFTNVASAPITLIYGLVGIFSLAVGMRQIIIGYTIALVGLSFVLIALGSLKATTN
jgi:nicotinamide riboside transporter PnuC